VLSPSSPFALVVPLLFCGGFLRSLQFTAMNAMSYADIENAAMSHATSLYTVAQHLSLSAGVALAAFVLEMAQAWNGDGPLAVADFAAAFVVVALFAVSSVVNFTHLGHDAGAAVSGTVSRPLDE
jgi:hypothetical protein